MGIPNETISLKAATAILPYSIVYVVGEFAVSATPLTGLQRDNQVIPIGVTDGSVSDVNGVYHALVGEPVTLQMEYVVQLRASNAITAGTMIEATTNGAALGRPYPFDTFENFRYAFYQCLEGCNTGDIFPAIKIGCGIRRPASEA